MSSQIFVRLFLCAVVVSGLPTLAHADTASSTPPQTASSTVSFIIRDGATIAYSGTLALPATTTPDVSITPTGGSAEQSVQARSVLAVLTSLDAQSNAFAVTDLQYFSSYGSFFVNCITIPADPASPLCGNWQYEVNGSVPQIGIDQTLLSDDDRVILYFGFPRQAALSKSTVTQGEPFTATAQIYRSSDNTFSPATAVTIGVTQANPADPYNPLVIATSSVNDAGQATFSVAHTGSYAVGIAEDYYYPAAPLTVTAAATTSASAPAPESSSSGGSTALAPNQAALSFLVAQQQADGSFGSLANSDWAALAFKAAGASAGVLDKLRTFLRSAKTLQSAGDYERHIMALEALGVNPGTDLVQGLVDFFDGTQMGSASYINDDIFALLPLLHAGYSESSSIIRKEVSYILSKQGQNGCWNDADMTAAAIQSLESLSGLAGVSAALTKARTCVQSYKSADGCYGNIYTSAWAIQALGSSASCLEAMQQRDGGFGALSDAASTRIWATAYALPALVHRSWDDMLGSFSSVPPAINESTEDNVSTTEEPLATSTAPQSEDVSKAIATSTQPKELTPTTATVVPQPSTRTEAISTTSGTDNVESASQSAAAINAVAEIRHTAGFWSQLWTFISSLWAWLW